MANFINRLQQGHQNTVAKANARKAQLSALQGNPNASVTDYFKAGIGPVAAIAMAAKAKAAQSAATPGGNVTAQNPSSRMGLAAAIKAAQAAKAPLATGFGTAVDRLAGSSTRNQMQSTTTGRSGFARMANNAMAARGAAPISPMQPTAISPQAFTNQNAISGMFGAANEGTFTRTVGDTPLMQMTSQGYIPPTDPTNPTEQNDVNAVMADTNGALEGYGDASMPPMGVETPITPTYDLNNL